ncbi:MAG TPA: response regulator [Thermoanaerobaculia bacterium]|jgi:signal transduction histidine kinase|nr:response regulator [Thermoanaerobaculia bacterium]
MTGLLRILIVDDSPEDRELYRRLLAQDPGQEYEFLEAELGEDGLELARRERPDCLLLDYRLPDVDGLEFLDRLLQDGPVPVIILTGQGSEAVAVQAMKSGAQDYLLKGAISRQELPRAVHNAVEKVALRRKVEERTAELARANDALQKMYGEQEELVRQRTAELSRTNEELKREIHERQRIEEERATLLVREQEARKQAEEANRIKDEFLATLSHELRTPLNAILGWAQVLRTGKVDESTTARALEAVERNARAQAQLISDLLDVSRIITGKLRLELKPVEIPRIIDAALDSVRPAADAKGIRIRVTLDRGIGGIGPLMGDPDRLQQVIWNLLSNAIKFTPQGGSVEVRLGQSEGQAEIAVQDTGSGVRPDFVPYVFDRFRQAESSTTRQYGGLGLGLSIVRHMVELHGGTVSVESPGEGQGSTFTVRLPIRLGIEDGMMEGMLATLTERRQRPAEDVPDLVRSKILTGLRVLVMDDEADTRDLLVTALEQCGAQVTAVPSVPDALASLDRVLPDVLLSDIGVPGEDGYSLIRKLRLRSAELGGNLPAAAVTAYARSEDRIRALAAGFQAHLAKPIDPAELVATIAALAGRQAIR